MKAKLETEDGKNQYKKRKQTFEPVFGIIRSAIGLARISHTTLRLKRIGRQFVTICDNDAEPRRLRLFSAAVSHHRRAGGVGVEHGGSAVSAS